MANPSRRQKARRYGHTAAAVGPCCRGGGAPSAKDGLGKEGFVHRRRGRCDHCSCRRSAEAGMAPTSHDAGVGRRRPSGGGHELGSACADAALPALLLETSTLSPTMVRGRPVEKIISCVVPFQAINEVGRWP